jgi:SAM-dependent methyltransferase
VLFDVFHHLEYPGTALTELRRVLKPGGRIVLFEPGMGLLGKMALKAFHHEPLGLDEPITWFAPSGFNALHSRYYAAQGNAWRIFFADEFAVELSNFTRIETRGIPALPWLLSGGFRGPQLCPAWARPAALLIERGMLAAPAFFASRLLVVLAKPQPKNGD